MGTSPADPGRVHLGRFVPCVQRRLKVAKLGSGHTVAPAGTQVFDASFMSCDRPLRPTFEALRVMQRLRLLKPRCFVII